MKIVRNCLDIPPMCVILSVYPICGLLVEFEWSTSKYILATGVRHVNLWWFSWKSSRSKLKVTMKSVWKWNVGHNSSKVSPRHRPIGVSDGKYTVCTHITLLPLHWLLHQLLIKYLVTYINVFILHVYYPLPWSITSYTIFIEIVVLGEWSVIDWVRFIVSSATRCLC